MVAKPTSAGFEPTRAEPNGFQVHRLNHSAKMSKYLTNRIRTSDPRNIINNYNPTLYQLSYGEKVTADRQKRVRINSPIFKFLNIAVSLPKCCSQRGSNPRPPHYLISTTHTLYKYGALTNYAMRA
jgi:hypothetical protein